MKKQKLTANTLRYFYVHFIVTGFGMKDETCTEYI